MTTITNNPFECGKKLKTGFDYFAKGFCKNGLVDAHYRLIADRRQAQLLLECASFEEIDDFYNPGEYDDESDRLTTDMVLEAVRVRQFGQTAKTMAALQRVLNKHLAATGKLVNDEPMFAGDAIIGKPKKSGLFASVTVQFPINDGQTLSIIFHSPDNNKMKITAADEIIAFRWLLNKRDITSAVAPDSAEEGTLPGMAAAKDVSLEEVGIRCAQLIAKNSDRFAAKSAEIQQAKKDLEEIKGQVDQLQGKNAELQDSLAAMQNDSVKTDAQIAATQKQLDAQVNYNDELRAKLDALKATGAGNAGKDHGEKSDRSRFEQLKNKGKKGRTAQEDLEMIDLASKMSQEDDAADFEAKKQGFEDELKGRGFEVQTINDVDQYKGPGQLYAAIDAIGGFIISAWDEKQGDTAKTQFFKSATLSGLDAQITKALAWIDKKLGEMKKVEKPQKVDPALAALNATTGFAEFLTAYDEGHNFSYSPKESVLHIDAVAKSEGLKVQWTDSEDDFGSVVVGSFTTATGNQIGGTHITKDGKAIFLLNGDRFRDDYYFASEDPDTQSDAVKELAAILKGSQVDNPTKVNDETSAGDTNTDRAEENAAVTILNDIIAGKYGMDRKKIDALLDEAAATIERLGMMELYDDRLNQAADELTRVLKEAAKGVA